MVALKITKTEESKIFYGWVVVIASFVIVAIGMGLVFSFGVFLKPLQEHFSLGRASLSFASSINWILLGVFSLVFGFLSDKIGTRKVVFAGGLVYGAGLLLTSMVHELWQLYITFGVMTGIGTGAFYVPLTSLAAKWFDKRRGVAVAAVTSGGGLGVLIFSPFSRFFIDIAGLQTTYIILGLIVLGVVLPLSGLLLEAPRAAEINTPSHEELSRRKGGVETQPVFPSGLNVNSSIKTFSFWGLTLTHFLCCTAHSGPIFHLVAFATDTGIPKMTAAAVFGIMGISSTVGRIGGGHIADKTGSKRALSIFLLFQAGMIFSFLFAREAWSFYASGIFFGLAYGGIMPMYALIAREYFGPAIMGTIYGSVFLVSSMGMGMGSYLGGLFFDMMGNYTWLYIAASLIASSAFIMSYTLKPPGRKLWHERLVGEVSSA